MNGTSTSKLASWTWTSDRARLGAADRLDFESDIHFLPVRLLKNVSCNNDVNIRNHKHHVHVRIHTGMAVNGELCSPEPSSPVNGR